MNTPLLTDDSLLGKRLFEKQWSCLFDDSVKLQIEEVYSKVEYFVAKSHMTTRQSL
jgi:hypothetical protein